MAEDWKNLKLIVYAPFEVSPEDWTAIEEAVGAANEQQKAACVRFELLAPERYILRDDPAQNINRARQRADIIVVLHWQSTNELAQAMLAAQKKRTPGGKYFCRYFCERSAPPAKTREQLERQQPVVDAHEAGERSGRITYKSSADLKECIIGTLENVANLERPDRVRPPKPRAVVGGKKHVPRGSGTPPAPETAPVAQRTATSGPAQVSSPQPSAFQWAPESGAPLLWATPLDGGVLTSTRGWPREPWYRGSKIRAKLDTRSIDAEVVWWGGAVRGLVAVAVREPRRAPVSVDPHFDGGEGGCSVALPDGSTLELGPRRESCEVQTNDKLIDLGVFERTSLVVRSGLADSASWWGAPVSRLGSVVGWLGDDGRGRPVVSLVRDLVADAGFARIAGLALPVEQTPAYALLRDVMQAKLAAASGKFQAELAARVAPPEPASGVTPRATVERLLALPARRVMEHIDAVTPDRGADVEIAYALTNLVLPRVLDLQDPAFRPVEVMPGVFELHTSRCTTAEVLVAGHQRRTCFFDRPARRRDLLGRGAILNHANAGIHPSNHATLLEEAIRALDRHHGAKYVEEYLSSLEGVPIDELGVRLRTVRDLAPRDLEPDRGRAATAGSGDRSPSYYLLLFEGDDGKGLDKWPREVLAEIRDRLPELPIYIMRRDKQRLDRDDFVGVTVSSLHEKSRGSR